MSASILITLCAFFVAGVSGVYTDGVSVSVNEGESVTLYTDVTTVQQERISWYFNDIKLAEITGGQSKICTDVQCDGRFRSRLILDHKNGSLTIKDPRPKDTGIYKLKITKNSRDLEKIFIVTVHGFFSTDTKGESAFVMEGDSVTLHTDVKTDQQENIRWYYYDTRIAQISGDLSKICTDVQCNKDTERFRDRLKLDHQTGSLTITDIRDPASGLYRLRVISSDTITEKIFFVAVYDVSAAEQDEMKRKSVKKGESVSLDPGEIKNLNDSMTWYFSDILIAEITGDPNKTCKDGQCEDPDGRFRNRLHLDHVTGSLTIMNTSTTDSGDYKLQMNRSRISLIRIFSVIVTDSGVSSAAKGGVFAVVVVVVVLLFTAAAVAAGIYYRHRKSTQGRNGIIRLHRYNEGNGALHSEWGLTDDC
ncbi:carcinoembryonic antigen-related cell adhesion molecule 3-like [Carassius auratus]|uniref:Carcinoembryonic antigen-related cell adhesion molecule 3-like n=1 Tax=Carassius auratus TaxID=7957 RepID=A0A6P6NNE1_CARAU|nr:carcinoembryonic antigen-related cell adhesion molecule 3-like [Carassius auratus]